ncbi:MAG: transposase [Rikenellaceae bacterium]
MKEKITKRWEWNAEEQRHVEVEYKTGKFIFTDEDRIQIVSDYVQGKMTAAEIVAKYNLSGRQVLLNWVDKFVNEQNSLPLPEPQNTSSMAQEDPQQKIKELEAQNKRLQQALELEKLRSKAFDTMINVAEETFNIPIRKKSGTKR